MSDEITTFPVLEPVNTASDGSTFSPAGTGGGFSSLFQGDIYSSRGRFGNGTAYVDIGATNMHSSNYVSGSAGWQISYDGNVEINNLVLYGGNISYGKTSFADSANAGYWMSSDGVYFGAANDTTKFKYSITDGTFDFVGTVSSRSTAILASAIDASGHFIDANLNTSAKTILKDFTFSPDDYSGAFKTGDIAWNTDTGAITSGTGFVINKYGIIGASGGTAKVSILSDGTATFAGALSAATGTFAGTMSCAGLTSGTITSKTITLDYSEGTGDCYIAAGKTDFTNTETGFIMGIDDSDSNKVKFIIGTPTEYLAVLGDTFVNTLKIGNYDVGSALLASADTERAETNPAVPTLKKTIKVGRPGNYRISFDYKVVNNDGSNPNTVYFRACYSTSWIFEINTVALKVGAGITTEYATQTFDYEGAVKGQPLCLYVYGDFDTVAYVKNFRLYVGATNEIAEPVITLD